MSTPHPTPEERYEAAHEKAALEHFDRKERRDVPSVFIDRIRPEMIAAIREAEAAGEAWGRAMKRKASDDLFRECVSTVGFLLTAFEDAQYETPWFAQAFQRGTKLGDESLAIVDHLERMSKL